jgi:Flp pilus assembly protein TadB
MKGGLEADAVPGNLSAMENDRRWRPRPPILDMTPEGEFREPAAPAPKGWLDRALARVGGVALLLAVAAGGLVVVALAFVLLGLLLPVVVIAGLVAFVTLWWRLRRLRARGGGALPFVVVRRQER